MLALVTALALFEPSTVPVELVEPDAGVLGEAWAQIRPVMLATLVGTAIVVLGFVANAVRVLLPKAFDWLVQHVSDNGVRSALQLVEQAAAAGVDAIEQTTVARLRAMEPAGMLDPAQRRQLFEAAMDAARSHVGPKLWAEVGRKLELTPERVTELLGTTIEAVVRRRKSGMGVLLSSEAITAPIEVGPPIATGPLPTIPAPGVETVRRG